MIALWSLWKLPKGRDVSALLSLSLWLLAQGLLHRKLSGSMDSGARLPEF